MPGANQYSNCATDQADATQTASQGQEGRSQAPATASQDQEGLAQAPAQASQDQEGQAQTPAQASQDREGQAQTPAQASQDREGQAQTPAQASQGQQGQAHAPDQNAGAPAGNTHRTTKLPERERGDHAPDLPPLSYSDLPSLMALYTQVPPERATLRRFGSDTFVSGTGNADGFPQDIPVGPDFVLGPGDNIVVNMWGSQAGRSTQAIDRQGEITLPEAGTITLTGMTISQAQIAIQALLNTQFKNEHVEISLGRVHTVRVYIVGDVQRPGAYDVSALSSPLGALYAAGGPTSRGSMRTLRQYRGTNLVREIDLYDFLLKGVRSDAERLLPGDVLMVQPVGSEIWVEGMVHHPAIYELNGEQTLSQVLNLAGGVLATASLKDIKVARVVAHERRTMLDLQLSGDLAQVQQQLSSFKVQDRDVVTIAQILPYTENAVFLEGHIYRPGRYPYREGMTVSDLLHSYQDVLPEPSDHAELVRLVPPDYHPETTPFNLHDLLVGNISLPLEPFDMIRVFGRYEIDAPMVSISGEVLRPGEYPMSKGMTVSALIKMAGGFSRSAYRAQADLASYEIQNGQNVLVNHREVAAEAAIEGDSSADVVLQPGDLVSVRQLTGWMNIGAAVSVSGEVEHPGSYAIVPGERLSTVLKRAGGFTADAYPPAAILERTQVRELSEQARQQMIRRIQNTPVAVRPGTMAQAAADALQQGLEKQRAQALEALRNTPASGRLVVNISADVGRWENTAADIELRAGDTLAIPKRPNFVIVSGQVFNPGAISYVPGRDLNWYLRRTGGPTRLGDKRTIYVLHADGSVTPKSSNWDSSFFHMRMRPGDDIFVPEKVIGGSPVWQNVIGIAQVMAAAALPLSIAGTL
jgi:protein involved in polysaccharide export with SLBB domain